MNINSLLPRDICNHSYLTRLFADFGRKKMKLLLVRFSQTQVIIYHNILCELRLWWSMSNDLLSFIWRTRHSFLYLFWKEMESILVSCPSFYFNKHLPNKYLNLFRPSFNQHGNLTFINSIIVCQNRLLNP